MNFKIHPNDIALITNDKVMPSFKSENCYLTATIKEIKDNEILQVKVYAVRTDLARYEDISTNSIDLEGNLIEITQQQLVVVEQRQDWFEMPISYAKINAFAAQLKPITPTSLSETDLQKWKVAQMFLMQRKLDAPWSIDVNQWRLRTKDDLIKDKPNA